MGREWMYIVVAFLGLGFMSSFFLVHLAYFELTLSLRRIPELSVELWRQLRPTAGKLLLGFRV